MANRKKRSFWKSDSKRNAKKYNYPKHTQGSRYQRLLVQNETTPDIVTEPVEPIKPTPEPTTEFQPSVTETVANITDNPDIQPITEQTTKFQPSTTRPVPIITAKPIEPMTFSTLNPTTENSLANNIVMIAVISGSIIFLVFLFCCVCYFCRRIRVRYRPPKTPTTRKSTSKSKSTRESIAQNKDEETQSGSIRSGKETDEA